MLKQKVKHRTIIRSSADIWIMGVSFLITLSLKGKGVLEYLISEILYSHIRCRYDIIYLMPICGINGYYLEEERRMKRLEGVLNIEIKMMGVCAGERKRQRQRETKMRESERDG